MIETNILSVSVVSSFRSTFDKRTTIRAAQAEMMESTPKTLRRKIPS